MNALELFHEMAAGAPDHVSVARACVMLQCTGERLTRALARRGVKASIIIDDVVYFDKADIIAVAQEMDQTDVTVKSLRKATA